MFVVALLAEAVISAGLPINQDDSAIKIARQLQDRRHTVLIAAYLSVIYAVAFVIYLAKLHDLIGFVLFLLFVLVSSVVSLRDRGS